MPLIAIGYLALTSVGLQDYTDANRPQWLVKGFSLAQREKMVSDMHFGRTSVTTFRSRYEAAVYFHVAVTTQVRSVENALDKGTTDVERASLIRANSLIPFYRRAHQEFAKELRALGAEEDLGIDRLETMSKKLQQGSPEGPPIQGCQG